MPFHPAISLLGLYFKEIIRDVLKVYLHKLSSYYLKNKIIIIVK